MVLKRNFLSHNFNLHYKKFLNFFCRPPATITRTNLRTDFTTSDLKINNRGKLGNNLGRNLDDSVRPTSGPTGNRFTSFTTTEIPPSLSLETTPDQTTEIYNFFGNNSTDFHILDSTTLAKSDTTKVLPVVSYSTVIGKFLKKIIDI